MLNEINANPKISRHFDIQNEPKSELVKPGQTKKVLRRQAPWPRRKPLKPILTLFNPKMNQPLSTLIPMWTVERAVPAAGFTNAIALGGDNF